MFSLDPAHILGRAQAVLIKGNVAVYKGLFLEHPSSHVIVITVYTFLSVY